jgi:hypothetical protein
MGVGWLLGGCFLREAPEGAIGSDRRAGKWGLMPRGAESPVKLTSYPVMSAETHEKQLVCLGSADSSWGWLCDLRWGWIWRRSPVNEAVLPWDFLPRTSRGMTTPISRPVSMPTPRHNPNPTSIARPR